MVIKGSGYQRKIQRVVGLPEDVALALLREVIMKAGQPTTDETNIDTFCIAHHLELKDGIDTLDALERVINTVEYDDEPRVLISHEPFGEDVGVEAWYSLVEMLKHTNFRYILSPSINEDLADRLAQEEKRIELLKINTNNYGNYLNGVIRIKRECNSRPSVILYAHYDPHNPNRMMCYFAEHRFDREED
jgi:hypothetical protein